VIIGGKEMEYLDFLEQTFREILCERIDWIRQRRLSHFSGVVVRSNSIAMAYNSPHLDTHIHLSKRVLAAIKREEERK